MAKYRGGRPKGSPNKKSLVLKKSVEEYGLDPIEGLKECLHELDLISALNPDQEISIVNAKSKIYLEIVQYLYPKRKAIEFKENASQQIEHTITLQWADEDDPKNEEADSPSKTDQPIN